MTNTTFRMGYFSIKETLSPEGFLSVTVSDSRTGKAKEFNYLVLSEYNFMLNYLAHNQSIESIDSLSNTLETLSR